MRNPTHPTPHGPSATRLTARASAGVLIVLVLVLGSCAKRTSAPLSAAQKPIERPLNAQGRSEAAFVRGAIWALVLTYDDDADDPSLLLASLHQLQDDEQLAHLHAEWQEPLSLGLARAHELGRLAPQLRALRQAFADAFVDELTGALSGVDAAACRRGLVPPADGGESDDNLVVTIEPLGPHRLSTLKRLCRSRARPPAAEPAPSQTLKWPSSAQGQAEVPEPSTPKPPTPSGPVRAT